LTWAPWVPVLREMKALTPAKTICTTVRLVISIVRTLALLVYAPVVLLFDVKRLELAMNRAIVAHGVPKKHAKEFTRHTMQSLKRLAYDSITQKRKASRTETRQ